MIPAALRANAVRAQALQSVALLATPSDDMTPILYAQSSGLFRSFGLEVTVTTAASGAAAASAVSSGTYAFGKSSLLTLLVAHEKGLPYTLVAGDVIYDRRSPYVGFIVSAQAGLRTGKDFADKLIGVSSLGDMGALGLEAWVEAHGGDPARLRFVEIPLSAGMAAVDAGRVAAAEASEPILADALESGKLLVPAYDVFAKTFLMAAWFTTRDYSQSHPDVVRAFARAFAAAATYTNAHHAQTAAMIAEFTHVPISVIQRMSRAIAGTALVPSQIQPVIDTAVKYGALERRFPARELIDPNAA